MESFPSVDTLYIFRSIHSLVKNDREFGSGVSKPTAWRRRPHPLSAKTPWSHGDCPHTPGKRAEAGLLLKPEVQLRPGAANLFRPCFFLALRVPTPFGWPCSCNSWLYRKENNPSGSRAFPGLWRKREFDICSICAGVSLSHFSQYRCELSSSTSTGLICWMAVPLYHCGRALFDRGATILFSTA